MEKKVENKSVVIKPVVSEKSYNIANSANKYTFSVDSAANKIEIRKAVETKYKVKVTDVTSITRPGKMKTNWTNRTKFRKVDTKKMIVTLKKGDKIDEFFNV